MRPKLSKSAWILLVLPFFSHPSAAQHMFENTRTVDLRTTGDPPVPVADFASIQDAIDDVPNDPTGRWTILIYAGQYNVSEPIELDGFQENIDLVGIDRDTVIINVTGTDKDGILITSGLETIRNNVIRNLTIKTANGHGIKIEKGGTPVPKGIILDNVIIVAAGSGKDGVLAEEVENLTISNSTISAAAGHGIELEIPLSGTAPKNITITNCSVTGDGSGKLGIDALDADGVIITGSTVTSDDAVGIKPGKNLQIIGSTVTGQTDGLNNTSAISGLRITRSTIQGTTGGDSRPRPARSPTR